MAQHFTDTSCALALSLLVLLQVGARKTAPFPSSPRSRSFFWRPACWTTIEQGTARGDVTRSIALAILAQVFGKRADETTPCPSLFHFHRSASGTGRWRSTSALDGEGPCSFRVSGPTMFQRRCRRADDMVTISRLHAMREFVVEVEEYSVGHHTAGVRDRRRR